MPKKDLDKYGKEVVYFSFGMPIEMSRQLEAASREARQPKKDFVISAIQQMIDGKSYPVPDESLNKIFASVEDVEKLKEDIKELKEQMTYMRKMLDAIFVKSDFMNKI